MPQHHLMTAQPIARARWRRCLAFSLAFRLLARIVLLDLVVFITGLWCERDGRDF